MSGELEFHELGDALRRGLVRLGAGAVVGVAVAALVLLVAPPRFPGRAMVVVRTESKSAGGLMRQQFGQLAHLAGDALGLGEGGDPIKTELALMQSRALLGEVVDSLRLQVRAGRRPALAVPVDLPPRDARFKPRTLAVPDVPGRVRLVDREDAIDDVERRLTVRIFGGETIEIAFAGRDSLSAAAVPNLVAARYLERRRTVDRGLNQRRVEFLQAQADSARAALAAAAGTLRVAQQRAGVVALELSERAEVEQRIALQVRRAEAQAELVALDALLAELAAGHADAARLAGFPALLKSPAINELVAEMGRLGIERRLLLAEATERAPRVEAMTEAIAGLRAQVEPIARTYADGLRSSAAELDRAIAASTARSATLPPAGEAILLREAEVKQLAQLQLGVGAELLDARLAALGEGGDVRVVDPAVTPRRVSFPRPVPTLAVGAVGGLLLGALIALLPIARRDAETAEA